MRRVVLLMAAGFISTAMSGRTQAIVHPNQIVGEVLFTNVNPAIRAVLDRTPGTFVASATSAGPTLYHRSSGSSPSFGYAPFEVTVETAEAGTPYSLMVGLQSGPYTYATEVVSTAPAFPEPSPDVRADIVECASLLRVFVRDESGAPVVLRRFSIRTTPTSGWAPVPMLSEQAAGSFIDVSTADLAVRGDGGEHDVVFAYELGSDPSHDTLRVEETVRLLFSCDQVTEHVIVIPETDGTTTLPRIIGRWDVVGEEEIPVPGVFPHTTITGRGPWWNTRLDFLDRVPSSGDFELENLVPGTWQVDGESCSRSGTSLQAFSQQLEGIIVPATGTADLGDTLVVDPGFIRGTVRIVGPMDAPDPVLGDVRLLVDEDRDGVSDDACAVASWISALSLADAGPWAWTGGARSGLDVALDPGRSELSGSFEMVAGGPSRGGSWWAMGTMGLDFDDRERPDVPPSYRSGYFSIKADPSPLEMQIDPGVEVRRNRHACTSDVYVDVLSTGAPFFAPSLRASGSFADIDFEGNSASWDLFAIFHGTPIELARAATSGLVVASLPEGRWDLSFTVRTLNPGGGQSSTALVAFPLRVGCRQIINLTNDVRLELDDLPSCTGPGLVRVTGRVPSTRDIARIAYSLDGAPWVDACVACGISPTFAFDVNVPTADSSILVQAWDVTGRTASVVAFSGLTGEPSARDLNPTVAPLLVRKSPGGLTLSWEDRVRDEFTIHQGRISYMNRLGRYDHGALAATCRQPGNVREILLPSVDAYFLVTESCMFGNGSFGRDSFGRERPPTIRGCP